MNAIANQAAIAIKNAISYQELRQLAMIDSLTNIYNRKHFYEILPLEVERMSKEQSQLGAVMVDINQLKLINDNLGHLEGDYYIREAANILKDSIRKSDYVFRFGGDEFLILCPRITVETIKEIVLDIKAQVAAWNLKREHRAIDLSLSIGYAITSDANKITELLEKADSLMYKDKRCYYCQIEN